MILSKLVVVYIVSDVWRMRLDPYLCEIVGRKDLRLNTVEFPETQKFAKGVDPTHLFLSSVERLRRIPRPVLGVSVWAPRSN